MTLLRPIIALFIVVTLSGCGQSQGLSREKAEEILRGMETYPQEELGKFYTVGPFTTSTRHGRSGRDLPHKINSAGLLTSLDTNGEIINRDNSLYRAVLNDKGMKYVRGEGAEEQNEAYPHILYSYVNVVTKYVDFGEINGIAFNNEAKTSARVEFIEVHEETPFSKKDASTKNISKTAMFRLYDDGWRAEIPN